jgi:hypothetical protein
MEILSSLAFAFIKPSVSRMVLPFFSVQSGQSELLPCFSLVSGKAPSNDR